MGDEFSDRPTKPSNADDPTRGPRRLLALLFLLALVAGGGAFYLSQRGSSTSHRTPPLFPARFSEAGFLTGDAALVTSYDAAANTRRTTGPVDVTGAVYVVARCTTGTIRVAVGALTSARLCTGSPIGVVALQMSSRSKLTATVSATQSGRWGVALYR